MTKKYGGRRKGIRQRMRKGGGRKSGTPGIMMKNLTKRKGKMEG